MPLGFAPYEDTLPMNDNKKQPVVDRLHGTLHVVTPRLDGQRSMLAQTEVEATLKFRAELRGAMQCPPTAKPV